MTPDRQRHVDAMFRARLSWTVIGAVGLLGLARDATAPARVGALLAAAAAFGWLNRLHALWAMELRRTGDARWKPLAAGLALRCVGLLAAVVLAS